MTAEYTGCQNCSVLPNALLVHTPSEAMNEGIHFEFHHRIGVFPKKVNRGIWIGKILILKIGEFIEEHDE